MKLAKNTDLVLTILYILCTVLLLGLTFLLCGGGEAIMNMAGGLVDGNIDPDSPSAGYELLARVFGSTAGALIGVFGFLFGILTGIAGIILLIITITACVGRKRYTATGNPVYIRKNLTVKMVCNSIVLALLLACVLLDFDALMLALVFVLAGLEIFLIYVRKEIE